jgi:hypothetical protein
VWAEREVVDDLFGALAAALPPPPGPHVEPSTTELEELRAFVAARFPAVPAVQDQGDGVVPLPRRTARRMWRIVPAAAAAAVLTVSGAAAADGGVPLPRPVRAIAPAVGFPVDSPALDDTHRHLDALREAVGAQDRHRAREALYDLHRALVRVPDNEQDEAQADVEVALAAAAPLFANPEAPAARSLGEDPPDPADLPSAGWRPDAPGTDPAPASTPQRTDDQGSAPAADESSGVSEPAPTTGPTADDPTTMPPADAESSSGSTAGAEAGDTASSAQTTDPSEDTGSSLDGSDGWSEPAPPPSHGGISTGTAAPAA